jgi:hypothetical protein
MGGGGEVLVAPAAPATLGGHDTLIRAREIMHQGAGFGVVQNGADRYLQYHVSPLPATAVGTLTMASALGLVLRVEAKVNQGVVPFARLHDDVAAAAAIAAGGAAAGNKFLPPEGHTAIAAIPRLHPNFCLIDEHCVLLQCSG